MSDYIHKDDAYEWLREKQIEFAEDDFAKVQAERDALRLKVIELENRIEEIRSTNFYAVERLLNDGL